MFQPRCLTLFTLLLLPLCSRGEITNDAIARATAAVQVATARAQADAARPVFHVTAPAQWINDPNGPIFRKGFYHLFYQLHPFSDGSGPKSTGGTFAVATWRNGNLCPSRSRLPAKQVKGRSGPVAARSMAGASR